MIIGIETKFDAAHFLPGHIKCGEVHGHTWRVRVEVFGEVDSVTGMVLDLHTLREEVTSVINKLDHKTLNNVLFIPTCELIVTYIKNRLLDTGLRVESVEVREGDGGWARV